jgi:hypothetical protein
MNSQNDVNSSDCMNSHNEVSSSDCMNSHNDVNSRVVYQIGIFLLVLVGISWYLSYRYQRKSWSVHFGIIFLARTPFSLKKGALAPFLRENGGTGPLFDTASPPIAEKRSSHQTSNTNQNTNRPGKSDTGKIPIPKKLLVIPWYLFIGEFLILKITPQHTMT